MNKTLRKFSVLILSGVILAACGDDDDAKTNNNIEPEFPTEFSDKTVEQNKAELQDNGIDLVNKITTLKSSSGIQTSIAFSEHINGATLPENIGGRTATPGINLLQILSSLGKGEATPRKVIDGMRVKADDFTSIADEYNSVLGVYTYSKANDTWTYTAGGDKIVFKFPSTKTGTTNNAEYAIYGYKGTTISSGIGGDDYTGDYPTDLKADLTIDGNKKMEYSFSTSYDSKGTPTNITTSIKIDSYTFLYQLTNTTTEAKLDYSLTEGSTVLFALGARGKGSFNVDDVESDASETVATASAYFQIMNVKFSGETDATALRNALESAETIQQKAAAYNANYKLIVFYADSKKKIADSEFYVGKRSYTDYNCGVFGDINHDGVVDEWDYTCEEIEATEDILQIRMVFADGSKSDLETYTDVGFSDLQKELEDFVNSFE